MNSKSPVWAIVPASGIGHRMQSPVAKQYLQLDNKTIIEHTLDRLLSFDGIDGLILVLQAGDRNWEALNYQFSKPLIVTTGGKQRHDSVFNGLQKLLELKMDNPFVMVHDAVRPLVLHQDLQNLLDAAVEHEAGGLLALPVSDTLKQQDEFGNIERTVPRKDLWRAFTPQMFRAELLYRAIEHVRQNNLNVTDDASAVEALGMCPRLVVSSAENLKITYPADLPLATMILKRQRQEMSY
jgi:2-C-methyl-D-erythritol 4-phosphate cytidylyltransferase